MRRYTPQKVTLIPENAERVFEGVIYDVYQWQQEMFDGSFETFEMIKRPDSVNIIAVHEDKIIISREEQPHVGTFIALPAGMHDVQEEDELQAAKRELLEETGYAFEKWKLINARQDSAKIERMEYTFLATNLIEIVPQQTDVGGERIEPMFVTFEELVGMKNHPEMRFYPSYVLDEVSSLDELLELPTLYDYGN